MEPTCKIIDLRHVNFRIKTIRILSSPYFEEILDVSESEIPFLDFVAPNDGSFSPNSPVSQSIYC